MCDRIAIMNEGEIKCCGSSSFLKENFGLGYRLTLNKKNDFDQYLLNDLLEEFFTNYLIETNIAAECTIAISVSSNLILIDFLNKLEVYKYHIGILNYGISSSSIEEVFLKFVLLNFQLRLLFLFTPKFLINPTYIQDLVSKMSSKN